MIDIFFKTPRNPPLWLPRSEPMVAFLTQQQTPPALADFAAWAAGRGLPAVTACGLLVLLALLSLVHTFTRRRRAAGFKETDNSFLTAFYDSAHVLALFQDGMEFHGSPRWQVYRAGCRELAFHLIGSDRVEKNFATRLRAAGRISGSQMDTVRRAMERAAGEISLDYESATTPIRGAASFIRWIGLLLGIAVIAEAVLRSSDKQVDHLQIILPALLPLSVSILLSLIVAVAAARVLRRTSADAARLHHFPAELSIMMERTFVDHGVHSAELPSVAGLGAPVFPGFDIPPSETPADIAP